MEQKFKDKEDQRIAKLTKMNKFLYTSKSQGKTPTTNLNAESNNKWFSKGLSFNNTLHRSSSKDLISKTFFRGGIGRFVKNNEALTKAIGTKFNIINKAVLLSKDRNPYSENYETTIINNRNYEIRNEKVKPEQPVLPKESMMDEEKDLADFVKSLDFEKYMNDIKIREALRLIKLKVENENNETQNQLDPQEEIFKYNENIISKYFNDQEQTDKPDIDKQKLPSIPKEKLGYDAQQIAEDSLDLKKKQYQEILNQLHKNVTLKTIHSTQSIMRILEREGLTSLKQSE